MRIVTITCCVLLFCLPALAQEYNYIRYNTEDGLAGSVVYDMAQDHDGFMWFATETGVSRFDGTHFKTYSVADGLPDNEMVGLFVDSRNRVWMIPFSNAVCYYHDGKIYSNRNDSVLKKITMNGFARFILENNKGEIAILQDTKMSIIKPDGTVQDFSGIGDASFETASAAGPDRDKFIFGVSQVGIEKIYEYANDSFRLVDSWPIAGRRYAIFLSGDVRAVVDVVAAEVYGRSDAGEFKQSYRGFLKAERLNDSIIVNSWSTHIELFNTRNLKIERTIQVGKNVNDFFIDSEGNWWFSSLGSGVYRLPSTEIKNYFFKIANDVFPVTAIEKKGDTLYAGTDNFRVWSVDLNTHAKKILLSGKGHSPGRITTINFMPDGSLIAGSETGIYKLASNEIKELLFMAVVKATHAHGDTLLVGSSWGTYEFDPKTMHILDTFQTARNTAVWKQGSNIYVGKLSGLYVLDEHENSRYLGDIHTSLAGKISAIRGASDGTIWVATYAYGIIGLRNEKIVAVLNTDSGLSSNNCRNLHIKGDVIWVGTGKGLNKIQFDGKKYLIKKYTVSDGLASDIINAVYHDGKTIFVGTPAGITWFDEEKVFTNSICRLKITGIQTPKHRFSNDTSDLQFGHYENNIRIEFSGISFKSGGDVMYRYRLKGLDDTWLTTQDNFLNYLSLPSGDYELELSATNKFGVESETLHLRFSVAKLLWEKSWFQTLALLLLVLAIYFFVRYRISKIRMETARNVEAERKMAELEQMALKAQMNPHFIFNSLHSIQQYVFDKDVAGANKYITDFARLIRLTLDISSQAKISLADEINYITTYLELEKAKYEGKFDYVVQVADDIEEDSIFVPAMLLQPYIENSIRHGIYLRSDKNGLITIDFSIQNEYLVCMVQDNGVGRKASEQYNTSSGQHDYKSKGMLLTARRIEMLNEQYIMPIFTSIEDVYDPADTKKVSGTRVLVRFPIQEVKKEA